MGFGGRRVARCAVVVAGLALLPQVVSCSRTPREDAAPGVQAGPATGGRLVVGIPQEPEMLNSILQITKYSRLVGNTLFSRFVTYDDSMRLVPDLIVEIPTYQNGGITPDNRTYTYKLRPEARWHDGTPLTSADVVFTYEAIMNPAVGAESQQGFAAVERVEAPDAHTVVFHLREIYSSFVADTFYDEDVLPRHILQDSLDAFRTLRFNRAPVGSGPFRFVEWVPGSHITVARHDAYHGGAPHLDQIVFKFVPDANALGLQLQAGDVHGLDAAEASQVAFLEKLPGVRLYRTQALQYENIAMNCERPALRDVRVRRALALATDRAAIAAHVYQGLASPAWADIHPMLPWYNTRADSLGRFDLEAARALLAEAGWRDSDGDGIADRGGKPLQLEIVTTAGRPARERTEAVLQQQWKQLGVDLRIRNLPAPELFGDRGPLRRGRFDLALYGWTQPVDPSAIQVVYGSDFVPPDGQNFGRFRNARFDSLAALGTRLVALEQRVPVYQAIEAVLLEQMPVIPLVWLVEADAMTARLREFRPNPTDAGDTWNVHRWWLEPAPPS
jgi:peptide/nickel transport system substrate-binding protein